MKKITALILLAAMLLSLAACGNNPSAGGAEPTPTPETSDVPPSEPPEETPAETDETDAEMSGQAGEPEAPSEPVLGVYHADSNTYENELLGLGCRLEEDWRVYDADEIAELNGLISDMVTDEAVAEMLESSGYVQAFYAQLGDDPVTVNITVENLGLLYGALLDEREYAELAVEQLPAAFDAMGMTDVNTEIKSTTFMGSEHTAVFITGQVQEIDLYEVLVCVKAGRYMACVTAASYLADVTGDVLDMFYCL